MTFVGGGAGIRARYCSNAMLGKYPPSSTSPSSALPALHHPPSESIISLNRFLGPVDDHVDTDPPIRVSIQYSVMLIRGNGVTLRTQKVIQRVLTYLHCRGEKGKPGLRAPKRFDESGLYLCHKSSV